MISSLYEVLMVTVFAIWILALVISFIAFIIRHKRLSQKPEQSKKRFLMLMLIILTLILLYLSLASGFLPNLWNNEIVRLLPYDFVLQYFCYDHIEYNGEHYYLLGDYEIPDEFIPFSSERIYVTIVDGKGRPFDNNRKEEARTYVGDDEMIYIYFGSAKYTKDKTLAYN